MAFVYQSSFWAAPHFDVKLLLVLYLFQFIEGGDFIEEKICVLDLYNTFNSLFLS